MNSETLEIMYFAIIVSKIAIFSFSFCIEDIPFIWKIISKYEKPYFETVVIVEMLLSIAGIILSFIFEFYIIAIILLILMIIGVLLLIDIG